MVKQQLMPNSFIKNDPEVAQSNPNLQNMFPYGPSHIRNSSVSLPSVTATQRWRAFFLSLISSQEYLGIL